MKFSMLTHASRLGLALAAGALLTGCGEQTEGGAQTAAGAPVVIYTNADEEAQTAMKHALDANGLKGAYLMQGFGTAELGGKLAAEGRSIEADVVTLSTYYLESLQQQKKLFSPLGLRIETLNPVPDYYAPILGLTGSLFVNTKVLEADKLPAPKAIEDLADPIYAGRISIPDITGSSTAWLMTQAVISEKGEAEGAAVVRRIEQNAGPHLEKSGSGAIKKIRAGEVAVGFGLRHQAVSDHKKGLPVDLIDPVEGNFTLLEAAAVVDKGEKTNPNARKVVETIITHSRSEMLRDYPVALYKGEAVASELKPARPRSYAEPLTVELLKKHQDLVKVR